MSRLVVPILTILLLLGAKAQAQFFPQPDNKDMLEKKVAEAEKKEKLLIARKEKMEEFRKQNEDRWKEFAKHREDERKDFIKKTIDSETYKTMGKLSAMGGMYYVGVMFYNSGIYKKGDNYIKKALQNPSYYTYQTGMSAELMALNEMAQVYEGEDYDDKLERKLEREISNQKKYIENEQKRTVEEHQGERKERLAGMLTWLGKYNEMVKRCEGLIEKIKQDTFDSRYIIELIDFYKDEIKLPIKAVEWCFVMKKYFPNDPYVATGKIDSYIAYTMGACGNTGASITELARIKGRFEGAIKEVRAKRDDIRKKVESGELNEDELDKTQEAYYRLEHFDEFRKGCAGEIDGNLKKMREFSKIVERVMRGR